MKAARLLISALCLAAALSVPAAFPAYADKTEVVGGAPGSESGSSNGAESSSQTDELVPALPVQETKGTEAAVKTEAPKPTEAPKQTEAPKPAEVPEQTEAPKPAKAPEQTEPAKPAPGSDESVSVSAPAPVQDDSGSVNAPSPIGGMDVKAEAPAAPDHGPSEPDESAGGPQKVMVTGSGGGVREPNTREGGGDSRSMVGAGSRNGVTEPNTGIGNSAFDVSTNNRTLAGTTDWSRVSSERMEIVNLAKSFVGGTYTYGGTTPESGFDCSGFVMYIMKEAAGISLYHQSARQAQSGFSVSASEMLPGDIIAYDGSPRDGNVNHVSIYIGDGKAVHAVGTGKGIRITDWDYSEPFSIRNVVDD